MDAIYIHKSDGRPRFCFDLAALAVPLAGVRYRQGLLMGQMTALRFAVRQKATLEALTE